MSFEVEEFGDHQGTVFLHESRKQPEVYGALRKALSQISKDFLDFQKEPEELEGFLKLLDAAVTAARGADISTLREAGLESPLSSSCSRLLSLNSAFAVSAVPQSRQAI
ncbi:hypothetical protein BYT27DRAFT_7258323 [Phlegmacium glaucopus]|nr:hypothetical protein BYT27DRAFT_7258323 [Phlegmacium glaucopus]